MGVEPPTPEQLETAATQPLINPYTERYTQGDEHAGYEPLTVTPAENPEQTPIENSSGQLNVRTEPVMPVDDGTVAEDFEKDNLEVKSEDEGQDEGQLVFNLDKDEDA